jgi:hypothetical protein
MPATAGSCVATRCAAPATTAVICKDDWDGSAAVQKGAEPADTRSGSANGRPPSGRVTDASQSQSSVACGAVAGAISSKTSKAWWAAAGWLSGERRSDSSPQP